jgi:hypothetical protein
LVIGGTCQQIYLLSMARSKVLKILSGHGGPIIELVANPVRSELLFSVGVNDAVRIWNWKTGTCIAIVEVHATVLVTAIYLTDCFFSFVLLFFFFLSFLPYSYFIVQSGHSSTW